VFARAFAARGERGWAIYSVLTGAIYFAAFFGIAAGSSQGPATVTVVNLAFSYRRCARLGLAFDRRGAAPG
jgi:hypothetical protein